MPHSSRASAKRILLPFLASVFLVAAGIPPAAGQDSSRTLFLAVVAPSSRVTGQAPAVPLTYDVLAPLARFDGSAWHEYSPLPEDAPGEWRLAHPASPLAVRRRTAIEISTGCVSPGAFAIEPAPAAWREPAEARSWMTFAVAGDAVVTGASDVTPASVEWRIVAADLSKQLLPDADAAIARLLERQESFLFGSRPVEKPTPRLETLQAVRVGRRQYLYAFSRMDYADRSGPERPQVAADAWYARGASGALDRLWIEVRASSGGSHHPLMILGAVAPANTGPLIVSIGTYYESQDLQLLTIESGKPQRVFESLFSGC